ncbi:MAG: AAA family ATPase [Gammaproteobacteria bacterium]
MASKQLWLLAGGNGAGKSTFYANYLQPLGIPFVNADLIAKSLYPVSVEESSYQAAKIAQALRYRSLMAGHTFCFETVFSQKSKIDFLGHSRALGYENILVFIHLDSVALNRARVAQRVQAGGHSVPDEKIESRIPRLLENVRIAIPLCDQARLLDNSSAENPFKPIATIRNTPGREVSQQQSVLPSWARFLLS